MKILLLGGCGFIGTNMAIEAISRGHEVVAFDNLSRGEVKNNLSYMEKTYKDKYQFVWGDVRKRGDFEKIPEVDAVINLAANPSVVNSIKYTGYDFETNTGGTVNSLDFAKNRGLMYIYASTNKVYSDITNGLPMVEKEKRFEWINYEDCPEEILTPMDCGLHCLGKIIKGGGYEEYTPIAITDKFPVDGFGKYGHSLYGVSKLSGELYCQEYHVQFGVPMVIFRMSCIYGLFQKGVEEQAWVDWFLRQIMLGDGNINIFGTGKQVRDVLDGRDTARAYIDALENMTKANGEIFTLGGGPKNTWSLLESIELIEKLTGKKAKLNFHDKRPADQDIYISDISKVKEKLGWEPKISLEQGIKDMIEQYKNE